MSTFKTERELLLSEVLVPELILSLHHFRKGTENYNRCYTFSMSRIRNQNELAVNSHEIKRRIDGLCEKFEVANYAKYNQLLREWTDMFIQHPIWHEHEQVDIQWAILEFLLELSFQPVNAMTTQVIDNKGKLIEFPLVFPSDLIAERHEIKEAERLSICSEAVPALPISDDELSEWSDVSESEESTSHRASTESEDPRDKQPVVRTVHIPGIKPPQKPPHYIVLKDIDSEQWLMDNVQHSWWEENKSTTMTKSSFKEAHFATLWNNYLDSVSLGLAQEKELSTTTEYLLLREIIWMFLLPGPKAGKFFRINDDGSIVLNRCSTLSSASLNVVQAFLQRIVESMFHIQNMRSFCKRIRNKSSEVTSQTLEIYASCIETLLKPIEEHLTNVENELIKKNDFTTCLKFLEDLKFNHLRYVDTLYGIHEVVTTHCGSDENYNNTAYFLAALFLKLESPLNAMENNLLVSILVPCLETYIKIFDSWWRLGKLYDYREEFLVQQNGEPREFTGGGNKVIATSHLISKFQHYCRESNGLLLYLIDLDRMHFLNELSQEASFEKFRDEFLRPFQDQIQVTEATQTEPIVCSEDYCDLMNLLLQEDQRLEEERRVEANRNVIVTARELFELFDKSQDHFMLPFGEFIGNSLDAVLRPRLMAGHKLVATIYLNEFQIERHFKNVQLIMLLESSAMHEFYAKLFVAIEEDFASLSPYQLTSMLETSIAAQHPHIDSLFTVAFDSVYFKTGLDTILDSLAQLKIEYNFTTAGIDFNATTIYQRAFVFLLQIKWSLWQLENMKFSSNYSKAGFFHRPNVLDFTIRRMAILKFWLLTGIKNIHSYLMNHVVECERLALERQLKSSTSLDQIQRCHSRFLRDIECKAFLKDGCELRKIIQEFLHLVLIFRDYWMALNGACDEDHGVERDETREMLLNMDVDQLEGTFKRVYNCFAEKLGVLVEANNQVHLTGLLGAFLHKRPTYNTTDSV